MVTEYMYKVCVRCMTFNHASYIEDALNGFAIQETAFPVVYCIVDDASTDGEQEVLHRWVKSRLTEDSQWKKTPFGEIIEAHLKDNSLLNFVIVLLSKNHYSRGEGWKKNEYIAKWNDNSKYVAICEGDDYWTDSNKLYEQVRFLETHDNYSFCHTGFDYYIEKDKIIKSGQGDTQRNLEILSNGEDIKYSILNNNSYRIQTLTIMMRTKDYYKAKSTFDPIRSKFLMGDTPMWLLLLSLGNVYFNPHTTGVYRVHDGSACRSSDLSKKKRFDLSCAEMRVYMAEYFSMPEDIVKSFYHQYYKVLAKYFLFNRDYKPFLDKKYCTFKESLLLYISKSFLTSRVLKKIYIYKNNK